MLVRQPVAGPTTRGGRMTIRTIAVDDDARYRTSLELLLEHAPEFDLVQTFASPFQAIGSLEASIGMGSSPPWDLVLMDLNLPELSGIECTRRMKELVPGLTIVVLTVLDQEVSILEAICAGADGYLVKHTPADQLLSRLREVMEGGSPLSAGVARTVLDLVRDIGSSGGRRGPPSLSLTPREQEVLRCLVRGMTYGGAAADLDVSIDTVRSHVRSIYGKLQVHTVAGAVSRALRERLV
jgi:DNA-binding NarL/FixJ family response regulator